MSKWVPHWKGGPGDKSFEIYVIRENNWHGKESFGWFNKDKLLITHNGGPCQWPLTTMIWSKCIKIAIDVANELNELETNDLPTNFKQP